MTKMQFDELPSMLQESIRLECLATYRKLPKYVMVKTKMVGPISVMTYYYE